MQVLARVLGISGIISTFVIFQQKERQRMLTVKVFSDLLWMCYYLTMGAFSGAAVSAIAMVRGMIFLMRGKKAWAGSPAWLYIFLCISIASGILTWKNAYTLLTLAASLTAIISFWIGKPWLSRRLAIPIAACMLLYALLNGAYEAAINETIAISSSVLGYFRLDRKKKSELNSPKEGEDKRCVKC